MALSPADMPSHSRIAIIGGGIAGVDRSHLESGRFEVNVAGDLVPVRAQFAPFYDPQRTRVLA